MSVAEKQKRSGQVIQAVPARLHEADQTGQLSGATNFEHIKLDPETPQHVAGLNPAGVSAPLTESAAIASGSGSVDLPNGLKTYEGIAAALAKYPKADLKSLARKLDKSLKTYPESAQASNRILTFHTQTTPDTVRLLVELVDLLCA